MSHFSEVNMRKLQASKSAVNGQFQAKRSAAEELATFQSVVMSLKQQPEKLRGVAVKAGIVTPAGNLKKAYKD